MKYSLKSLLLIIVLIFTSSNIFAEEKIYWNISTITGSPKHYKFKEYKGPFDTQEAAIANWIYESLPEKNDYGITSFIIVENKDSKKSKISYENQKLESRTPSTTYTKKYTDISNEFNQDRYNTMNKYKIIPIDRIEKKFSKKSKVFTKKAHPREYIFDIYDLSKEVFLKYENKNSFSEIIDLTALCSNDMPQKNDNITVYFDGKTTNILKNFEIQLYTRELKEITEKNSKKKIKKMVDLLLDSSIIVNEALKNDKFSGSITFKVKKDTNEKVFLKFVNHVKDDPLKINQTFLKFKKVVDSTNTIKEAEQEKIAEQKNIEIVEVKNTILEEEIRQKEIDEAKEKEKLEKLKIEEERKEKEEAERKLKQQKDEELKLQEQIKLQLELNQKQQIELEKALEEASKSNSINRYQREYLQDYEIPDDSYFNTNTKQKKNTKVYIENPNETDASGKTLLMKAAKSGNDWQIKNLIEAGADVNLQDKDGWTALMYSVRYQENLSAVSLLIKAGADIYIENNFKTSALTIATCYNNNPDILKQILKSYESSNKDVLKSLTMLFVSSQPSEFIQLAKLETFIQKAVPINTFYEGKTPLMYACQYGNSTEVIKVLLDNNAAVTLRSSEGKTAFDYASKNLNLEHDDIYWSLNRKR